jgi:hypothetical protein
MIRYKANQRSSDTHLVPFPVEGFPGIDFYFKDESSHPTGSPKHRLAHSPFLYALVNGWLREGCTVGGGIQRIYGGVGSAIRPLGSALAQGQSPSLETSIDGQRGRVAGRFLCRLTFQRDRYLGTESLAQKAPVSVPATPKRSARRVDEISGCLRCLADAHFGILATELLPTQSQG